MQLSKLEKVDLREVWNHEALNFTNWLAKPENLELLSDEIGIDLLQKFIFGVQGYKEQQSG